MSGELVARFLATIELVSGQRASVAVDPAAVVGRIAGDGRIGDGQRAGSCQIPPPSSTAELPEMVELVTVNVPSRCRIPPPSPLAELPEMVELVTVNVPEL